MICPEKFIQAARKWGFGFYTGVPCSYLKPFINYVIDSKELRYVGAANEGDAVSIGSGVALSGKKAVVMFQNSGLGNAVNPLTSLNYIFKLPILLIITLRGDPNGDPDEVQHHLMGKITTEMLDLMEIKWSFFPIEETEIDKVIERVSNYIGHNKKPYALIMKKGSVKGYSLKSSQQEIEISKVTLERKEERRTTRNEILRMIQSTTRSRDIIIATTGYTGRELYTCGDRENQFYMVGSMGCASSLGLGLAIAEPNRRIIVIDGDGALLMRMGALTTIGYENPRNLTHILLDNEIHESTGGQSTTSHSVDFGAIAAACGYSNVRRVSAADELGSFLNEDKLDLNFFHVKIKPGIPDKLPRPSISPEEVTRRLMKFIKKVK